MVKIVIKFCGNDMLATIIGVSSIGPLGPWPPPVVREFGNCQRIEDRGLYPA